MVRLDSTVAAALMHEPSDSSLLWDGVRVLVRLLKAADALAGGLKWRNHRRAAKKRARAIEYARDRLKRVQHYRQLIKLTRATLAYADQTATQLWRAADPVAAALWQAEFRHYRPLIERIVAQTERRVLHGEAVGANEKIVSLFEPHADIIIKGGREVQYGHKLNLTAGRTGLILDLVIEAGNPADSERFLPMLKRHIAFYGQAPRQTAADGGFASRDNLAQAKALGVHDAAFHKKAGLRIMDMVKSNWVYRKLRNFRAGIESDISCLKRAYGLARCLWRGLDHFTAYVWSSSSPTTLPSSRGSGRPDSPSAEPSQAWLIAGSITHSNPCAHRAPTGPRNREMHRMALQLLPSESMQPDFSQQKHMFMDGNANPRALRLDVFHRFGGLLRPNLVPLVLVQLLSGFGGEVLIITVKEISKLLCPTLVTVRRIKVVHHSRYRIVLSDLA